MAKIEAWYGNKDLYYKVVLKYPDQVHYADTNYAQQKWLREKAEIAEAAAGNKVPIDAPTTRNASSTKPTKVAQTAGKQASLF